tara:strand:+ start:318 stop:839 length:522 start_codon:yes stop_codon:yes gene_type:complete
MTWAKIVEGEVVQIFDGDPTGHWHPDALVLWEDVPDDIGIAEGWHKKEDGTWINGEQYQIDNLAANPIPPPGPPTAIIQQQLIDVDDSTTKLILTAIIGGEYDLEDPAHIPTWNINNGETVSNDFEVTVQFTKTNQNQTIPISLTVVGSGGDCEEPATLAVVIPHAAVTPSQV